MCVVYKYIYINTILSARADLFWEGNYANRALSQRYSFISSNLRLRLTNTNSTCVDLPLNLNAMILICCAEIYGLICSSSLMVSNKDKFDRSAVN